VEQCNDPLLRLAYLSRFLEEYLASTIFAPVYLRDCLPAMCDALGRPDLGAVDPLFAHKLRMLADDPRLLDSPDGSAFAELVHALPARYEFGAGNSSPGQHEMVAPVILVLEGGRFADLVPRFGLPTRLRVRAYSSFGGAGQIFWKNRLVPDDPIQKTAHDALAAAVKTLGIKKPRLRYSIEVEEQRASLAGASLGLAMALVFHAYESGERGSGDRIPRSDAAYIGAIDSDAEVQPVAPNSIGSKLRAAAAAGLEKVVLPLANLEQAREELAVLQRTIPRYAIPHLVPVQRLGEIAGATEATKSPRLPVRALVRRERRPPLWAALLAAFVLVLGAWLVAPSILPALWSADRVRLDVHPRLPARVVARLAGFPFSQKTWNLDTEIAFAEIVHFTRSAPPALLVGSGDDGPHPARVELFDVRSKRLLWSRDYSRRAPLPEDVYRTNVIRIDESHLLTDLDNDGVLDIVVTSHTDPLSPCFVIWLDRDGNERGFYAHRGYLFFPVAADMNADGKPEVYVCGTSNSDDAPYSQRGTLVALDSDHFGGWPGDGPFKGSGPTTFDSCLARIIFPPIPDHCLITESAGYTVKVVRVRDGGDAPIISLELFAEHSPGSIVVSLDRDLEPVNIIAADGLKALVDSALKSGRIAEDFTRQERLEKYAAEISRVR